MRALRQRCCALRSSRLGATSRSGGCRFRAGSARRAAIGSVDTLPVHQLRCAAVDCCKRGFLQSHYGRAFSRKR